MTRKRSLIIALIVNAAAAIPGWPLYVAFALGSRFNAVSPGMTEQQVRDLMGFNGRTKRGPPMMTTAIDWNHTPLPADAAARVAYALTVRAPGFPVPVTYEFTFDAAGVIVGKHRYD